MEPPARGRPAISLAAVLVVACTSARSGVAPSTPAASSPLHAAAEESWLPLFDGATLEGWKPTAFGGQGSVEVVDGRIVLGMGSPLTGLNWSGDAPTSDYEIELDASRLAGSDFFCGLTFPVGDSHATLVLGGWGGGLCGLSCLDREDAAHNETTSVRGFEKGRAYRVRVRVRSARIQCWLDEARIVDVRTTNRRISLRDEVEPCKPLGVASYETRAAIWNVRLRRLGAARASD